MSAHALVKATQRAEMTRWSSAASPLHSVLHAGGASAVRIAVPGPAGPPVSLAAGLHPHSPARAHGWWPGLPRMVRLAAAILLAWLVMLVMGRLAVTLRHAGLALLAASRWPELLSPTGPWGGLDAHEHAVALKITELLAGAGCAVMLLLRCLDGFADHGGAQGCFAGGAPDSASATCRAGSHGPGPARGCMPSTQEVS